ncbi:hypothetical protein [Streptosporangium sp. 'caverna']|uniref:hypothetical protein n=1 Tax=Streptosporangium sp. 'caverna' TaxID=2202249 RepID=UPI0013A6E713|nr:hypothetical protein [Streptosporangium sp. 'caverna']
MDRVSRHRQEEERLTLLREHRERVTTQIDELTRCLSSINYKVGAYEDIPAQGAETTGEAHPGA